MAKYKRICIVCGKEFSTRYHNQKTCSGRCSVKHLRDYQRAYHKTYRKTRPENRG